MKEIRLNPNNASRERLVISVAWIFMAISLVIFSWQLIKRLENPGSDFASYYTAGYLVSKGEAVSRFYDDMWFINELNKAGSEHKDIYNANLPTMAVFATPLALWSEKHSRVVWILLSLLALFYLMQVSANIANMGHVIRPIWYGVILLSQPVMENLKLGQVYIVIAAGFFWIYQSLLKKQETKAGVVLAVLLMFKTAGTMLWPYFVVKKQWKLMFSAVGAVLFIIIITFPIIGSDGWLAYFEKAIELSKGTHQSVTAYQTVQSWFQHLFSPHPILETKPIVALPLIISYSLATSVIILMLSVSLWLAYKYPKSTDFHFAAFSVLVLICMPVSMLHTYMIAIVPIALLLKTVNLKSINCQGVIILVGATMILTPLPFRSSRFFDGYWSLLAYPKLYGAFLLWLAATWLILKSQQRLSH